MRRSRVVTSIGLAGALALIAIACSSSSSLVTADAGSRSDASGAEDGSAPDLDSGLVLPLYQDAEAGGACEASAECPPGLVCWYPVAEGCAATGVCTVLAASMCGGPYCTCRGDTTAVCGDFGQLPMLSPLRGPPCGAVMDSGGEEIEAGDASGNSADE